MEMLGTVAPIFSTMLRRGRLVESFRTQSPPLTLICAAAGYGKTVLASQLALQADCDALVWVQLPDSDVSEEFVLHQVADSLDCGQSQQEGLIAAGIRSPDSAALDDSIRIRKSLQRLRGSRVLLVVDGANGLSGARLLAALAADLTQFTSPESRMVVSCRRLDFDSTIDPGVVWLIEEDDLALTQDEVTALLSDQTGPDCESRTRRLYEYCLGHPAITRILLRHGIPSTDARPRDLVWQTERIVTRLDEDAVAALYLAAVLGQGEIQSLHRCALACDMKADWAVLSRSIPLFHLLDAAASPPCFRVHAILSDVVERLARDVVSADDRAGIRAIAFEQLSRDHEYVGLSSALEMYGTEDEVARWCALDGVSMIRHAGHSAVAKLLARLSPLSIASSARLLMLRSHVQRAAGATAAALESAIMAKRVAEVSSDRPGLLAAALLIARLHFDRGSIAEPREILEEVEAHCQPTDDLAAHCLVQAYLAFSDGQAGRLYEAAGRMGTLSTLARRLDQGSDEAVFVANCMGAVACQCTGDWRAAAAVLGPIAQLSDVAPLQQVHVRSNYAVALYELGDCLGGRPRAESVFSLCLSLGLTSIRPYAAASLSDLCYSVGDSERGRELDRIAMESFDQVGDGLGRATHGINLARTLRALGAYEESLSSAIAAESFLADQGPGVRMTHLLSIIEVASSHLALGDVALANAALDRVLAEPAIRQALGHSLRCGLILAEMDRLSGERAEGVARIVDHADYIASGSANMTLACYIRAFPGLLGLVDEALGSVGLPARVVRLLPADTVASGLAVAIEALGPDASAALVARYAAQTGKSDFVLASAGVSPSAAPFLRVRAFGRLEIESSYGRVEHRHWRKRKSRLLFLMLLCAPAHEIPRDVILERLWPDMTRANAQRNLYVTWSHLRKALACENEQEDIGQFAGSSSDACWLTGLLQSDLDQFRAELMVLHAARAAGDGAAVVASASLLADIYRGELLPIDIYEEWFEEDRTRARRDFCDAMVTGAQSAVDAQQHDSALVFLKRVSAIDPWREDVYQLMMRCQMFVGQRSGAIETYNICRTRLVDDLGIDPCAETVRIFQAVLAMEEESHFGPSCDI
ncbi:MAG: AfsR/SARP family transcriptional regulator [Coriobacteriia bacterium]